MVLAELREDEGGLPGGARVWVGSRGGDPDEAGDVVRLVLDVLAEDRAAVELGRRAAADRGPRLGGLAEQPHRFRGAAGAAQLRFGKAFAQEAGALGERLGMGEHGLDPA